MIRNAIDSDFVACVDIAHRAWPEFKERESIYHLLCKFFSDTCFVDVQEATIRGFLLGFRSQVDPADGYIHLVAVDPPAQRQGIAARLYREFIARAKKSGVHRVRLIVNPDNTGSLNFHHKLGFEPDVGSNTILVGNVLAAKDYNGPGIHMVPFALDISSPGETR